MRLCETCGVNVGQGRSDRRFCSPRCRVAAHRSRERAARASLAASFDELDEHSGALAEDQLVALIERAAQQHWRASAWLLERRFPQPWAARRQLVAREQPRRDGPLAEFFDRIG